MGPVDATEPCNPLHGRVQRATHAGRAVVDPARVRLGVVEQFRKGLPRRVGTHYHTEGVASELDYPGKVSQRVEGRAGRHMRDAKHARGRHLREQVAVRPRVLERHCAERAGRAGSVLDDDWLAEMPGRQFTQGTHLRVGGVPWRPGHDHADRPVGKAPLSHARPGCGCGTASYREQGASGGKAFETAQSILPNFTRSPSARPVPAVRHLCAPCRRSSCTNRSSGT